MLLNVTNRSDFRHCSKNVSVTISHRRVRTHAHDGVKVVGGRPPPLCRSTSFIG